MSNFFFLFYLSRNVQKEDIFVWNIREYSDFFEYLTILLGVCSLFVPHTHQVKGRNSLRVVPRYWQDVLNSGSYENYIIMRF